MNFLERLDDVSKGLIELGVDYVIGMFYNTDKISIHVSEFKELGDLIDIKFESDYTQDYPVKAYRIIRETEFFCLLPQEEIDELKEKGNDINE